MKATQLLKEPLLHFLVIGAALFGAYAWLNRDNNDAGVPQVRLAVTDVQWLKDTFALQWQRQPSDIELRGLIRGFVKEELFARQAQELGLDKDDIVVRRRLAQKMTYLLQDDSARRAPSEDDLRRVYEELRAHGAATSASGDTSKVGETQTLFTRPRISFAQVFFSRDRHADADSDARAALPELLRTNASAAPDDIGDHASVKSEFHNVDARAVANQFGAKFAAKVFDLPPGSWQGPFESSQGVHLVRVTAVVPGELRPLEQVREQIIELWREQQEQTSEERYFGELLQKYKVVPDESVKALLGPALAEPAAAKEAGDGPAPRSGTP
jgi:hypothetical protein